MVLKIFFFFFLGALLTQSELRDLKIQMVVGALVQSILLVTKLFAFS